jgi:hypothetical protein
MYESPKLNQVGDVQDVVLGVAPTGDDIDATWVVNFFEFAPEEEFDEE